MRRIIPALILVALAAAGCGSTPDTPATPEPTGAQRIVSLSPVHTEMLFAIGAGSQVVAVDELSNYPTDAPRTDLSGYTPNAEAVAAYQPDLVVVSYDTGDIVSQLKALDIDVYLASGADTVDDAYQQITDLGALTGHEEDATELVDSMKHDLADLVSQVPSRTTPLTYFYEVDQTLFTATSKTFAGTLFTAAGLRNIADAGNEDNPWPQLSEEVILAADPDLIFTTDGQTAADLAARPGWSTLTAVRNGAVVVLDADIASRWGPRIVDLQRDIVKAVADIPAS
jgi:iron complex transport system substrate-binding protein